MYNVTRKQFEFDPNSSWSLELEDSKVAGSLASAKETAEFILKKEVHKGGVWHGPNEVVFKSSSFYRSVYVTIEEIQ